MLYFRQILIMLVSLYTVRVMLEVLGAEDYGIYTVVAGIVTMFSFLSGAMATASQRYFSYELGRCDQEQLRKTFSLSLTIYVLLAAIAVLLAETVGLWFVHTKLIIPPERIASSRWIYQASVVSFVFTILTTPFMAVIIAHEDMNIYAYVSILEVLLRLGIIFLLPLFAVDKLILYGLLMATVIFISTTIYRIICLKKYAECRSRLYWDTPLFIELMSYTGWNMFGASVGIFKFQAVNIILNQFFTPIVITARGIASQVNSAVNSFAQNFSTAVRPQIIKSFAAGDIDGMTKLVYRSCKGTFFLMYMFTLPLCLETPYILKLWLRSPPEYAVLFTQLALIDALIDSLSYPLMTAAQATGKIKLYQGIVGGVLLLNLPFSFIALEMGLQASSVFIVAITLTAVAFLVRLVILSKLMQFPVNVFLTRVAAPLIISAVLALSFPLYLHYKLQEGFLRLVVIVCLSVICSGIAGYFIALSKIEKQWVMGMMYAKSGKKCSI